MKQGKNLFLLIILLLANLGISQNYNPIINYRFDGTPLNGVKIKTNMPFQDSQGMPTITIEGYEYSNGKAIGLTLVWYIYGGNFINYSVSSFGDYVPTIQLSNESGKVVIFIADKKYYNRFTVRGYENLNSNSTWFQGWTIVDELLTGINTVTVPYKNSFAGNINFPGASIWNSNGFLGIGTSSPTSNLEVNGNIQTTKGAAGKITLYDDNTSRNNRIELYAAVNGANISSSTGSGGTSSINFSTAGNTNRMRIIDNGNVGIGTVSPGTKLEVNGNVMTSQGAGAKMTLFDNNSTRNNRIELYANENGANIGSTYSNGGNGHINFNTIGNVTAMKILDNGNIGIGTTTPQAKLDVSGQVLAGNTDSTSGVNAFSIRYQNNGGNIVNWGSLRSSGASFMGFGVKASSTIADGFESANSDYSMERSGLVVGGTGNALQLFTAPNQQKANGTAIAMNQVFKISNAGNAALQGKFQAKEIKVTNSPTADFVFEEDYNLPKLEEVEKHIKEKKHLPEIASAKEMEKDGVNVGEFQIKLLQKIEELTLYTIEQNKEIQELKAQVKALLEKK